MATASQRGSPLAAWIRASRPLAAANLVPGVALGLAVGAAQGAALGISQWSAAGLYVALTLTSIVWTNDWADRSIDRQNLQPTLISGGSRVLVDGQLSPHQLRRAAIAANLALLSFGAILASRVGNEMLAAWVAIGVALSCAYSLAPIRLSRGPGGEWAQALGMGLVLPQVGALLTGASAGPHPLLLVSTVALAWAGHQVSALPDAAADAAVGKQTGVVRRGTQRSWALAWGVSGLGAVGLGVGGIAPVYLLPGALAWLAAAVIRGEPTGLVRLLALGGAGHLWVAASAYAIGSS